MKNVHLIPTDKLSRLGRFIDTNNLFLRITNDIPRGEDIDIYITSDGEIKDCWVLNTHANEVYFLDGYYGIQQITKKIILSTDVDLIKDGVQAIDDEFLEWFVKNPSCEEVEVRYTVDFNSKAVIIIPQGEPKQDYSGVHLRHCYQGEYEDDCKYGENDCPAKPLEPKQEVIEEAAENYGKDIGNKDGTAQFDFIRGAQWQSDRMYSEEDMRKAYFSAIESTGEGWNGEYANGNNPNIEENFDNEFQEWFEQFKNK